MKFFFFSILFVLLQHCSFDNKSGIWKNENSVAETENEDGVFQDFKTISSTKETFNEIIPIKKNFKITLSPAISNYNWNDIFFNKTNNTKNFKYNDSNKLIFKSKKLSKYNLSNFVLFEANNLITYDEKGNIIIFSINENKILSKFNFYKKRYKKIKKILNLIVEDNIIYISDNIGYLYAYNYNTNKILWAKNYKIPFRSNLKLSKDKLIASNQNNNLYFFNKKNGNMLNLIPTEETIVKNQFVNNLSLGNESLFFLNTYGSLYSIDIETMRINWFINLNQSLDINPNSLFTGNQIVLNKNKVIISSNQETYIIDQITGTINFKKKFSATVKPVISNNYLFLITKNNLLVSIDLVNGSIIYSYDINEKISKFLNTKKYKVNFKNLMLINNNIFIFLKNSYILKLNIDGELKKVFKLPSKISSQPILIDDSILFINQKKKLFIVN